MAFTSQRRKAVMRGLEDRLQDSLREYRPLVEKVKMPPKEWRRAQKREYVAEQLIKMGVNKYIAYAIAARKIKE